MGAGAATARKWHRPGVFAGARDGERRGHSAVDQLSEVLDSPEIASLVSELEATRWTRRPGYPIRSMVGMALAKSIYSIPDVGAYRGARAGTRRVADGRRWSLRPTRRAVRVRLVPLRHQAPDLAHPDRMNPIAVNARALRPAHASVWRSGRHQPRQVPRCARISSVELDSRADRTTAPVTRGKRAPT